MSVAGSPWQFRSSPALSDRSKTQTPPTEISFSLLCLIPGAGRWLRVFLQPATWPGRRCWPAGFRTESVCMPAGLLSRLDCSTDAAAPAFCSDRSLQRGVQMACSALQIVLLSTARRLAVRRHVMAHWLQPLARLLHRNQREIGASQLPLRSAFKMSSISRWFRCSNRASGCSQ